MVGACAGRCWGAGTQLVVVAALGFELIGFAQVRAHGALLQRTAGVFGEQNYGSNQK